MTSSVSPFIVDASELSPIFIPGNSHMGLDNLPILRTMRVKILLVLQFWTQAEVTPSRRIPDYFQEISLLPFYLLGKGKAPRIGCLAVGCCQLKRDVVFKLMTSTTSF